MSDVRSRVDDVDDETLNSLIAKLSLERKVRLLTGADCWGLHDEPDLGLRRMVVSDGPSGIRGETWDDRDPALNLPSATALGASWDTGLAYRYGAMLATEARRKGADVVLGPTINLHRSPLGGRHFECWSEDPWLTGAMAVELVRGLQDWGVAATAKHYVANDAETERFDVDIRVVAQAALVRAERGRAVHQRRGLGEHRRRDFGQSRPQAARIRHGEPLAPAATLAPATAPTATETSHWLGLPVLLCAKRADVPAFRGRADRRDRYARAGASIELPPSDTARRR
jgi:hypothetical protein